MHYPLVTLRQQKKDASAALTAAVGAPAFEQVRDWIERNRGSDQCHEIIHHATLLWPQQVAKLLRPQQVKPS